LEGLLGFLGETVDVHVLILVVGSDRGKCRAVPKRTRRDRLSHRIVR
jgi:hypothetical protein